MFDVGEETVVAGAIREGLKNVFRAGLQPADLPDEEVVLLIKRGRQEEFFPSSAGRIRNPTDVGDWA